MFWPLKELERSINETQAPLHSLEQELGDLRKAAEERQAVLQKEKSSLQRSIDQMTAISSQIER